MRIERTTTKARLIWQSTKQFNFKVIEINKNYKNLKVNKNKLINLIIFNEIKTKVN